MQDDQETNQDRVTRLEDENVRLQRQIDRLERRLTDASKDKPDQDRLLRGLPSAALDESDRLARALFEAIVESFRSTADAIRVGLDNFDERRAEDSAGERISIDDFADSVTAGVQASIDSQEHVIRKFVDCYDNQPLDRRKVQQSEAS